MSYYNTLAFLGGSVGTGEWIVLFVVVLIVVGPKRLPEVARKMGRMMETFRRAADEFKSQLMTLDDPDPEPSTYEPSDTTPYDQVDDPTEAQEHITSTVLPDYPGNEGHVESWMASQETPASPPGDATGAAVEAPPIEQTDNETTEATPSDTAAVETPEAQES